MRNAYEACETCSKLTPSDSRHILFRYRRKGTDIMIGASFAWLIAVVTLAIVRPEVFGLPAALAMFWKSWRRG